MSISTKNKSEYAKQKAALAQVRAMRKAYRRARTSHSTSRGLDASDPNSAEGGPASDQETGEEGDGDEYAAMINLLGPTNFSSMFELFKGSGAPPTGTNTDVVVSFELFESVQTRAALTKSELDQCKVDLLKASQKIQKFTNEHGVLRDRISSLERQLKESEDYCQRLRLLSTEAANIQDQHDAELDVYKQATKAAVDKTEAMQDDLNEAMFKVSDSQVLIAQRDAAIASLKREKEELQRKLKNKEHPLEDDDGGSGSPMRRKESTMALKRLKSAVREVNMAQQLSQVRLSLLEAEEVKNEYEMDNNDLNAKLHAVTRRSLIVLEKYEASQMSMHDVLSGHKCEMGVSLSKQKDDDKSATDDQDKDKENEEEKVTPSAIFDYLVAASEKLVTATLPEASRLYDELDSCREASVMICRCGVECLRLMSRFERYLHESVSLSELRESWDRIEQRWFTNVRGFADEGINGILTVLNKIAEREVRMVEACERAMEAKWQEVIASDYIKRTECFEKEIQTEAAQVMAMEIQIGPSFLSDRQEKYCMTDIVRGKLPDTERGTWTDVDYKIPDWIARLPMPPADLQGKPRSLFEDFPKRLLHFHVRIVELAIAFRKKMKLDFAIADPAEFMKRLHVVPTIVDGYEVVAFDEEIVNALLSSLLIGKKEGVQRLVSHKKKAEHFSMERSMEQGQGKKLGFNDRQKIADFKMRKHTIENDIQTGGYNNEELQKAIQDEVYGPDKKQLVSLSAEDVTSPAQRKLRENKDGNTAVSDSELGSPGLGNASLEWDELRTRLAENESLHRRLQGGDEEGETSGQEENVSPQVPSGSPQAKKPGGKKGVTKGKSVGQDQKEAENAPSRSPVAPYVPASSVPSHLSLEHPQFQEPTQRTAEELLPENIAAHPKKRKSSSSHLEQAADAKEKSKERKEKLKKTHGHGNQVPLARETSEDATETDAETGNRRKVHKTNITKPKSQQYGPASEKPGGKKRRSILSAEEETFQLDSEMKKSLAPARPIKGKTWSSAQPSPSDEHITGSSPTVLNVTSHFDDEEGAVHNAVQHFFDDGGGTTHVKDNDEFALSLTEPTRHFEPPDDDEETEESTGSEGEQHKPTAEQQNKPNEEKETPKIQSEQKDNEEAEEEKRRYLEEIAARDKELNALKAKLSDELGVRDSVLNTREQQVEELASELEQRHEELEELEKTYHEEIDARDEILHSRNLELTARETELEEVKTSALKQTEEMEKEKKGLLEELRKMKEEAEKQRKQFEEERQKALVSVPSLHSPERATSQKVLKRKPSSLVEKKTESSEGESAAELAKRNNEKKKEKEERERREKEEAEMKKQLEETKRELEEAKRQIAEQKKKEEQKVKDEAVQKEAKKRDEQEEQEKEKERRQKRLEDEKAEKLLLHQQKKDEEEAERRLKKKKLLEERNEKKQQKEVVSGSEDEAGNKEAKFKNVIDAHQKRQQASEQQQQTNKVKPTLVLTTKPSTDGMLSPKVTAAAEKPAGPPVKPQLTLAQQQARIENQVSPGVAALLQQKTPSVAIKGTVDLKGGVSGVKPQERKNSEKKESPGRKATISPDVKGGKQPVEGGKSSEPELVDKILGAAVQTTTGSPASGGASLSVVSYAPRKPPEGKSSPVQEGIQQGNMPEETGGKKHRLSLGPSQQQQPMKSPSTGLVIPALKETGYSPQSLLINLPSGSTTPQTAPFLTTKSVSKDIEAYATAKRNKLGPSYQSQLGAAQAESITPVPDASIPKFLQISTVKARDQEYQSQQHDAAEGIGGHGVITTSASGLFNLMREPTAPSVPSQRGGMDPLVSNLTVSGAGQQVPTRGPLATTSSSSHSTFTTTAWTGPSAPGITQLTSFHGSNMTVRGPSTVAGIPRPMRPNVNQSDQHPSTARTQQPTQMQSLLQSFGTSFGSSGAKLNVVDQRRPVSTGKLNELTESGPVQRVALAPQPTSLLLGKPAEIPKRYQLQEEKLSKHMSKMQPKVQDFKGSRLFQDGGADADDDEDGAGEMTIVRMKKGKGGNSKR